MNVELLVILILVSCLGAVGFLAAFVWLAKREGESDPVGLLGEEFSKGRMERRMARFYQKAYVFFMRTPFLKRYTFRLRRRLETVHAPDEFALRKETARLVLVSLGSTLLVATALVSLSQDAMYIAWVVFGAVILHGTIVSHFTSRVEDKLLAQLVELFENVRHFYQQHGMVDEAIYDAMQVSGRLACAHADRVYEVLVSEDATKKLEDYYETAPNKYLKVFAGVSHMVMEYGDRQTTQGSMYLSTLTRLVQEINLERIRRARLQYRLQGLIPIAVLPVVFLDPVETWAKTYFPVMESFYDGKAGFATKIAIFVLTLICYVLLRRLSASEHFKLPVRRKRKIFSKKWPERVLGTSFGKRLVRLFCPSPGSRPYHRTANLLRDTGTSLSVEEFFINRVTLAALTFVAAVFLFVGMHMEATWRVYGESSRDLHLVQGSIPAGAELIFENALQGFDNEVIRHFRGKSPTREEIVEYLTKISGERNAQKVVVAAERIHGKILSLESEYFKWWELLVSLLLAQIAYFFPVWMLYFQRRMRFMDMQDEVNEFHVLIGILAKFERVSVEMVLEWMERYARIFRQPLQKCLIDYDSGAEEALENLKADAPFAPFVRIVEKLQLAQERLPVAEAFDDLEAEMEYYKEQRKLHHEKSIEQKSTWGMWLGFAPGMATVFLYMVAPLLYASVVQMNEYLDKLRTL